MRMDDARPPDEDLDVSSQLYQTCPVCLGAGKFPDPGAPPGSLATGCLICGRTGFVKVGLTVAQVDRLVERERCLKGDPGVPADRRRAVLEAVQREAAAALVRLGVTDQPRGG